MHKQLAIITSAAAASFRDGPTHDTYWVYLDLSKGGSQGYGGLYLPEPHLIEAFEKLLMFVVGVKTPKQLVGKQVYALKSFDTWGSYIDGIMAADESGRKMTRRSFCAMNGLKAGPTVLEQKRQDLRAELKRLESQWEETKLKISKLDSADNGYVEWD